MKPVYKHLSGQHRLVSRVGYVPLYRADGSLGTDFFLGFRKFLGKERAICGVTSDLEAIKCAAFNIFIHEGSNTFWNICIQRPQNIKKQKRYRTQINNTLEIDKTYFKLGSNLYVFRGSTNFPCMFYFFL